MLILWRETYNHLDLLPEKFKVTIKKIVQIGEKKAYLCRLSILEKDA